MSSCKRIGYTGTVRTDVYFIPLAYGEQMKLYNYLTGPDDETFCRRVTERLNRGWLLYGGPTLTFNGQQVIAGQAVVREVPDEEYTPETNFSNY